MLRKLGIASKWYLLVVLMANGGGPMKVKKRTVVYVIIGFLGFIILLWVIFLSYFLGG